MIVVMALSSPWSRLIASRLAARGLIVHIAEFRSRGPDVGYLERDNETERAAVEALEKHVFAIHRFRISRSRLAAIPHVAFLLRRLFNETKANVVITLYGGANAAAAYLSGVRPYVVYAVGSDVLLASGLTKSIARVALNGACAVLANGNALAAAAAQAAKRARVMPLYLGTEVDQFAFSPDAPPRPVFVCTRGFLPVYDNETIVRAFAKVASRTDTTMTFASSGPLLERCRGVAGQLMPSEQRDKLVFLNGVSETKLKALLATSSYYISASLSDGTSSSLLEAFAAGLFPIVTDIPANREWITHGENGLLFPPGDDSALAECMRRAMLIEEWTQTARLMNRRLVETRANVDLSMARLAQVLRDCASGASPRVVAEVG